MQGEASTRSMAGTGGGVTWPDKTEQMVTDGPTVMTRLETLSAHAVAGTQIRSYTITTGSAGSRWMVP